MTFWSREYSKSFNSLKKSTAHVIYDSYNLLNYIYLYLFTYWFCLFDIIDKPFSETQSDETEKSLIYKMRLTKSQNQSKIKNISRQHQ